MTAAAPETPAAGAPESAAVTPGQAELTCTFTWDYREQPPMEAIGNRIAELTGGAVTMEMPETGSDEYELVIAARQPQPAPDSALTVDDFYAERAERLHRTGERDAARSDLARVKRAVLGTGTHQAKIRKILAIVDPIPGDEPQQDDDVKPAPELAQVLSSPAELALWVEANHGDHPEWVDELRALLPVTGQPAPELADPVTVEGVLCRDYPAVVAAMQAALDRRQVVILRVIDERDQASQRLADLASIHEDTTEHLGRLQDSIGNLAAGLKLSADASRPSKKTEIEDGYAAALLGILDPR